MPRNRNNRPVQVTDLSHEVPTVSADENNHARTRANGWHAELERAHRRIAELERELERERTLSATRGEHLRRRTAALWTAIVTLAAHAGYGMGASAWLAPQWWFHTSQLAGVLAGVGYLIAPNVRRLLHLSSETADPEPRR